MRVNWGVGETNFEASLRLCPDWLMVISWYLAVTMTSLRNAEVPKVRPMDLFNFDHLNYLVTCTEQIVHQGVSLHPPTATFRRVSSIWNDSPNISESPAIVATTSFSAAHEASSFSTSGRRVIPPVKLRKLIERNCSTWSLLYIKCTI